MHEVTVSLGNDGLTVVVKYAELKLSLNPFSENRSSCWVTPLSSCCARGIITLWDQIRRRRFACEQCGLDAFHMPRFPLTNEQNIWRMDDTSSLILGAALDHLMNPLTAALAQGEIQHMLIHLMERASVEYAWLPEGNIASPSPLTEAQRQHLCLLLVRDIRDRQEFNWENC